MTSSSGAIFSGCRTWRYVLWRRWKEGNDIAFIGLNPSIAAEYINDPTVTRCARWAYRWGYGGMFMLNAFGYRSTDPKGLLDVPDPIGPENDFYIHDTIKQVKMTIAIWGTHAHLMDRHKLLVDNIPNLYCLAVTKDGYPRHPRGLKNDVIPVRYDETLYSG